jgi:hypothetical protein
MLQDLDTDVTIYALYRQGSRQDRVMEVLRKYENASGRVSLEVIDPDANPSFAQRYAEEDKSLSNGSIVVAGAERHRVIPPSDLFSYNRRQRQVTSVNIERRVSNAVAYLQTGNIPVVYQLTGHNEYTLSDLGMKEQIEKSNYRVQSLNLIQQDAVPDDAGIVTVFGPESDLSEAEAEKLRTYLDDGGSVFFMVNFQAGEAPVLNGLLEAYGLNFRRGVIIEQKQNYHTGNQIMLVPDMLEHPIMKPLKQDRVPVMMPRSQPVQMLEVKRRELEVQPLLETSEQSLFRSNLDQGSAQQAPSDEVGSFTIAATVHDRFAGPDQPTTRIVAVGSADFLSPAGQYGVVRGNVEFFQNSLGWLQNQGDLISLGSKSVMQFPLQLTGLTTLIYAGIIVVLIPLGIFVGGLIVYLRRRHL